MPEFYIDYLIIARKIFSRLFGGGGARAPCLRLLGL